MFRSPPSPPCSMPAGHRLFPFSGSTPAVAAQQLYHHQRQQPYQQQQQQQIQRTSQQCFLELGVEWPSSATTISALSTTVQQREAAANPIDTATTTAVAMVGSSSALDRSSPLVLLDGTATALSVAITTGLSTPMGDGPLVPPSSSLSSLFLPLPQHSVSEGERVSQGPIEFWQRQQHQGSADGNDNGGPCGGIGSDDVFFSRPLSETVVPTMVGSSSSGRRLAECGDGGGTSTTTADGFLTGEEALSDGSLQLLNTLPPTKETGKAAVPASATRELQDNILGFATPPPHLKPTASQTSTTRAADPTAQQQLDTNIDSPEFDSSTSFLNGTEFSLSPSPSVRRGGDSINNVGRGVGAVRGSSAGGVKGGKGWVARLAATEGFVGEAMIGIPTSGASSGKSRSMDFFGGTVGRVEVSEVNPDFFLCGKLGGEKEYGYLIVYFFSGRRVLFFISHLLFLFFLFFTSG